jgi:septum site-determining protein MinC
LTKNEDRKTNRQTEHERQAAQIHDKMKAMKIRGTLGGFSLLIESQDTAETLREQLLAKRELLANPILLEFTDITDGLSFETALELIKAQGGHLKSVRVHSSRPERPALEQPILPKVSAVSPSTPEPQETVEVPARALNLTVPSHAAEIVRHSLRSGTRAEFAGGVVILGDVNSGVEVVAGGDIVVLGTLRGVVHAGVNGDEKAVVIGYPIASPLMRIAGAVANDPDSSGFNTMKIHATNDAQVAYILEGRIQIKKYTGDKTLER